MKVIVFYYIDYLVQVAELIVTETVKYKVNAFGIMKKIALLRTWNGGKAHYNLDSNACQRH